MASIDGGSVLPPPRYASHEFPSPYLPSSSGLVNNVATSGDGPTSSPRCGSSIKQVSSVSVASMNHTAPSPSYPMPNSWPGFDAKNGMATVAMMSNNPKNMTAAAADFEKRQRKPGVFVFTSKMANEAYESVRQCKYESMLAWHEANCRPSTSTANVSSPSRPDGKRKSMDTLGKTPEAAVRSSSGDSPKLKKQLSESCPRVSSTDRMSVPVVSSSSDLLVNEEVDPSVASDNPLRRMEQMTHDSLFEPPAKITRGASSENDLSVRKLEDDDPERESRLAKLTSVEKLMHSKGRVPQPQCSQVQWDRMLQEQEVMKIPSGYPPQMMSGFSNQPVINGPPPYQMPGHGMPSGMHPAFRRAPFMAPISPQVMSPVPPANGPVMDMMGAPGMPVPLAMRASLNPPPYNMHMAPEAYMSYEFAQSSFSSQAYSMNVPSTIAPAYNQMFSPVMNGAPMPPRGCPVYAQGLRPMYSGEKVPDVWGQQLPQPLSNLEARVPNQKIQYHPNGAVIDENLGDNVNCMSTYIG